MKKILVFVIAVIAAHVSAAQPKPLQNTLLWKISGKDLAQYSYIYLTGKTCDETLKLNEKASQVLNAVNSIVAEYDLYGSKDAGKLAKTNIALTDSQKINTNLSAIQVLRFENMLKDAGYPAEALPQLRIYKLNMVLYMLTALNGPCGVEKQPLAYEVALRPYAKKLNKEFTVLQNIDEFLAENNRLYNAYWVKNIGYVLENGDGVKKAFAEEADLYAAADLSALQKLYNSKILFNQLYNTDVQKEHSLLLADKIEAFAKQGPAFFTIQFANVMYDNASVFEKLTQKGYTITPVLN